MSQNSQIRPRTPATPREARMVAFEYMRQLRGGSGSAAYKKYERRLRERAVVGLPLIIENPTGRELANFRSWFHRNYEVRTWTMHGNLYIELES